MTNICETQEITQTQGLIDLSINSKEVQNLMNQGMSFTFLDVRNKKELAQFGYISGSINIEMNKINDNSRDKIVALLKNKPQIIVYCAGGRRSMVITKRLREWGLSALNLADGYFGWMNYMAESSVQLNSTTLNSVPNCMD